MDKGEGLEQKSNDWERAKRKHIDWGHIRNFEEGYEKTKKKKKEKKKELKKRRSWNCLRLKASQI
jgi:hypothetical protein